MWDSSTCVNILCFVACNIFFECFDCEPQPQNSSFNSEPLNVSVVGVHFQTQTWLKDAGAFKKLTKTKLFADKTLMIREIFCHKSLILTAPRYFGKTLNLNMLRLFLSNDQNISEVESIFENTKVWLHKEFVRNHLCSHPILYCSFQTVTEVTTLETLVSNFQRILLALFYEHFYLNLSDKLKREQKLQFAWYIKENKRLNLTDLINGFHILSKLMCLHFEKKIIFLIDDYDSVILNNIFDEHYKPSDKKEEQVNISIDLLKFHKSLLCNLIKDEIHIGRVIMTGIMTLEICCSPAPSVNLKIVGFLQNDRFSKFYGFTKEELLNIIFKFHLNRDERCELEEMYNGYYALTGETYIYNPLSISEFILSRTRHIYWCQTKPFRMLGILPLMDNLKIQENMIKIANKTEIAINLRKAFLIEDIALLKRISENWWDEETDTEVFFQILLQMGYLTFGSQNESIAQSPVKVRVPNEEVRKELMQFVSEYFDVKDIKMPDLLEY